MNISEKKDLHALTQDLLTLICLVFYFRTWNLVLVLKCHMRQCIALFAVTEGWLLLDIG